MTGARIMPSFRYSKMKAAIGFVLVVMDKMNCGIEQAGIASACTIHVPGLNYIEVDE